MSDNPRIVGWGMNFLILFAFVYAALIWWLGMPGIVVNLAIGAIGVVSMSLIGAIRGTRYSPVEMVVFLLIWPFLAAGLLAYLIGKKQTKRAIA
jgi:hypothetical protein